MPSLPEPGPGHGSRVLMIADRALAGGPADDLELGPVLLAHGMDDATEFVRVYRPEATAAFSRRDTLLPGFGRAAEAARELGFVPVVRHQGGRLAAYHSGSVVIDHVLRESNAQAGLRDRFERYAGLHAQVLAGLGLDARIGELPGEYCPGEFSVNAAGASKIVGSAQRITRDGWLFSSVIQVTGSAALRHVLTRAYAEIGYELDPSTIGAMEDYVPGITAEGVAHALRRAYVADLGAAPAGLTPDLLDEVARRSTGNRY